MAGKEENEENNISYRHQGRKALHHTAKEEMAAGTRPNQQGHGNML